MQAQKKSVLLVAQLRPCGDEDAKGCLHRVLKPIPPRKALKWSRKMVLQLQAPACQSWIFQQMRQLEDQATSRTQLGLGDEPMEVDEEMEEPMDVDMQEEEDDAMDTN